MASRMTVLSFWSEAIESKRMRSYHVYVMANITNSTVYIGVTNNLVRRASEHKGKLIPGFTAKYNINKLVYWEDYDDPNEAIKREKALKNMVRRKKNQLVESKNPSWRDLYFDIL